MVENKKKVTRRKMVKLLAILWQEAGEGVTMHVATKVDP